MVVRLLLPFLLSTLLGVGLSINLVPDPKLRAVVLWTSPAAGVGVSALLFYLWSLIFYPTFAPWVYAGLELLIAAVAFLIYFLRRRRSKAIPAPPPARQRLGWEGILLSLALGACLVLLILTFIQRQVVNPYGEWDALMIWNMRARHLYLGGEGWRNAFSPYFQHADYPVLISLYIARCWSMLGEAWQAAPQLLGGIFTLATIGSLAAVLRKAKDAIQGLVAAIVLACTTAFLYWGASQYADVPLSLYILAACALVYFYNTGLNETPGLLVLAGWFASLALWTKNEGAFLLVGILLTQLAYTLVTRKSSQSVRPWIWFVIGLLPALALLLIHKLVIAPPSYVLNQSTAKLLEKLATASRYKIILRSFAEQFLTFGWWNVPLIPLLLVYTLLAGIDLDFIRKFKQGMAILAGTLAIILLVYFAAYLVTPLPLDWQIRQSIGRLLLQIFPSALFLLFLALRNPLARRNST